MIADTLRIFEPQPGVLAFYDGRIDGVRLHGLGPNWLDDGAFVLGAASYAILSGEEALVYDTHITPAHAAAVRAALAARGARTITVVLSHWHKDHVAGNAVFADCAILARAETIALLHENRAAIEAAEPPIRPLVMPTRSLAGATSLRVGDHEIDLLPFDIHSRDGLVLWRAGDGLLLAGDTLEDTVTYVAEPDRLDVHRADLQRMARLPVRRILPNHGAPERIATGGYGADFIAATQRYTEALLRVGDEPALAASDLRTFVAEDLASGAIGYFAPYEAVHRSNVAKMLALAAGGPVADD